MSYLPRHVPERCTVDYLTMHDIVMHKSDRPVTSLSMNTVDRDSSLIYGLVLSLWTWQCIGFWWIWLGRHGQPKVEKMPSIATFSGYWQCKRFCQLILALAFHTHSMTSNLNVRGIWNATPYIVGNTICILSLVRLSLIAFLLSQSNHNQIQWLTILSPGDFLEICFLQYMKIRLRCHIQFSLDF